MSRILIALDVQPGLKTPEVIVQTTNKLAKKLPTIATVLLKDKTDTRDNSFLEWEAPAQDDCRVETNYIYERHGYQLPPVILQMLQKNKAEEVLVVGASTEAFLLAAGFALFDAGFKVSLIAPLCLTGQYHQHTVTLKIWENSIGQVYETVSEVGVGVS